MELALIIAVVASALVVLVVLAGLVAQHRRDQEEAIERIANQHLLANRLPPPVEHRIHLPEGPGADAAEAVERLRQTSER
jgi:hypothetical protein